MFYWNTKKTSESTEVYYNYTKTFKIFKIQYHPWTQETASQSNAAFHPGILCACMDSIKGTNDVSDGGSYF